LEANVDYVVIPSQFNPGEENEFHLAIYTENHHSLVENCKPISQSSQKPNEPGHTPVQSVSQPSNLPTLKVTSAWITGKNAGGCTNEPTWKESPQFILEVPQDDKVTINLKQLQKPEGKYHHIGFIVMKSEPTKKRKFNTTDAVYQTQFMNAEFNTGEVDLPAGAYNIITCTFKPNLENTFELSATGKSLQKGSLQELTPANDWKKAIAKGAWVSGKSGGCGNNKSTFLQNPLFRIDLSQADTVKIVLEVNDNIKSAAGYYLWSTTDGKTPVKQIGASNFLQSPKNLTVSKDWQLETDKYLIMPATFEPNKLGTFTVSAYSVKDDCKLTPI